MNKVFLGGTCNDSNWRDYFEDYLRMPYFNPVVDDWNEQSRIIEENEKFQCDHIIYNITPLQEGMYTIAELTIDSLLTTKDVYFNIQTKEDVSMRGHCMVMTDKRKQNYLNIAELLNSRQRGHQRNLHVSVDGREDILVALNGKYALGKS